MISSARVCLARCFQCMLIILCSSPIKSICMTLYDHNHNRRVQNQSGLTPKCRGSPPPLENIIIMCFMRYGKFTFKKIGRVEGMILSLFLSFLDNSPFNLGLGLSGSRPFNWYYYYCRQSLCTIVTTFFLIDLPTESSAEYETR